MASNLRTPITMLAFAAALLGGRTARAQTASDAAAAEALFDDAKKAAASGDWASACPKYSESNRLDPGIGVKLYLADCYEHVGKTASAWAMFGEAEDDARKMGDARAAVAKEREDRLAPRLVRLIVVVPDTARVSGLAIRRDGEDVGVAQWGVPVPVDPGTHAIEATAPGKRTWSTRVDATESARTVRAEIPVLEDASSTAAPGAGTADVEPSQEASSRGRAQRTIALVVGGAGVVGIGIGTVFGIVAKSKLDQSNDGHCHDGNLCDATGVQLRSDSLSAALGSTIAFSVGLAAVAAGAVLWLTAPKAPVAVGVVPVGDGLGMRGSF